MQLNSLQRAVDFIRNFHERGVSIKLKADGSTPATLGPLDGCVKGDKLATYLLDEVRLPNFQDAMRAKGHGSIYLTTSDAEAVLHIRVLPGPVVFHYVD